MSNLTNATDHHILTTDEFLQAVKDTIDFFNDEHSFNRGEKLIELLSPNNGTSVTKIDEKMNDLFLLLDTKRFINGIIPYDKLTELIFGGDFDGEQIIAFSDCMHEYSNEIDAETSNEETLKVFLKIHRHINLAIIQRKQIKDHHKDEIYTLKKENTILKSEIDDQKNLVYELNDNVSKASNEVKGITTQFIAILGIFASILMGAFGGLTILGNVLTNIQNVDNQKILIFSPMLVMAIIFIIFVLLNGIAKLTNLKIRSCSCKDNNQCTCSVWCKHPSLKYGSVVSLIIICLGFSGYIIDYKEAFVGIADLSKSYTFLFLLLLGLSILNFITCSYLLFVDKKNLKTKNDTWINK